MTKYTCRATATIELEIEVEADSPSEAEMRCDKLADGLLRRVQQAAGKRPWPLSRNAVGRGGDVRLCSESAFSAD